LTWIAVFLSLRLYAWLERVSSGSLSASTYPGKPAQRYGKQAQQKAFAAGNGKNNSHAGSRSLRKFLK
jgi:hypothetical protein